MQITTASLICFLSIGLTVAQDDEDAPTDHLLPYLERCCQLGQEFARSRLSCDEAKLRAAHQHHIAASNQAGVSNITCTISAAFCCEETLEREIHCDQGINAAMVDATCSKQTDLTAKACCNWCRAGLHREPNACEELPAETPMYLREAFTSCCARFPSKKLRKKCGSNDCNSAIVTCLSPIETCTFDDQNCHYRCIESSISCQIGFRMDEYGRCLDIDECALRTHSCAPNEICINEHGSYRCKSCDC
ncbi:fibulin-1-like [Tropilaelaps mercedesae]|uniref:Fibulin-1-like n=1 Tax=Tropilaelaps mercedesae TaxID=418985 RepID=A0A1V9XX38_9ACAR|nr:fibulin-1-like [Tropilaelaps mercedesae]